MVHTEAAPWFLLVGAIFFAAANAGPTTLPAALTPTVAYYDAASGVFSSIMTGYVQSWTDMNPASRPANILVFTPGCSYTNDSSNAAVNFANGCFGIQGTLPGNWGTDPGSAFTLVWIGRFAANACGQQMWILGMNRDATLADNELIWTSHNIDVYSGGSYNVKQSSSNGYTCPPTYAWTMETLVRKQGGAAATYYRYSDGGRQSLSWDVPSSPSSLGASRMSIGADARDSILVPEFAKALLGQVSVVLVFNRALAPSEVHQLADVYGPRFGLNVVLPQPPSPPPSQQQPSPDQSGSYGSDDIGGPPNALFIALPAAFGSLVLIAALFSFYRYNRWRSELRQAEARGEIVVTEHYVGPGRKRIMIWPTAGWLHRGGNGGTGGMYPWQQPSQPPPPQPQPQPSQAPVQYQQPAMGTPVVVQMGSVVMTTPAVASGSAAVPVHAVQVGLADASPSGQAAAKPGKDAV